jgi:hypothetical protein
MVSLGRASRRARGRVDKMCSRNPSRKVGQDGKPGYDQSSFRISSILVASVSKKGRSTSPMTMTNRTLGDTTGMPCKEETPI